MTPFGDIEEPIPDDTDDDACPICGGTEENCIVGIGIGLQLDTSDIQWVECAHCTSWFHLECVGIEIHDLMLTRTGTVTRVPGQVTFNIGINRPSMCIICCLLIVE